MFLCKGITASVPASPKIAGVAFETTAPSANFGIFEILNPLPPTPGTQLGIFNFLF